MRPEASLEELRAALGGPLPKNGPDAAQVVAELIEAAEPGVMAMRRGRFFGFVIGGALPAASGRLAGRRPGTERGPNRATPSAGVVEEVVTDWLRELLGLPQHVSAAFVTGCQMAP